MGFNTKLFFALSVFTHNCCNSSNYKRYDLERDRVCKQELSVGRGNLSGIIVRHMGDFDDWDRKKDYECSFYVKANFNMGLFAVIQQLNLRRNKDTYDCIDYIQFRHNKKKTFPVGLLPAWNKDKKDEWSAPICGKVKGLEAPLTVGPEAASNSKETDIVPHAFHEPQGEIEIKLHVSKQDVPEFSLKDLLLVIAFTSYIECKVETGGYKPCGHFKCIYKEYFNDKIVNCPYSNCLDEPECPDFVFDGGSSFLSTKVTITAVSSIFLSFFIFLGCIMLCRYMEIMCWSGNPRPDRGTELSQVEPTAPPLPSPDKDLPPAYETLFPANNR